jgi:hypothetical protein
MDFLSRTIDFLVRHAAAIGFVGTWTFIVLVYLRRRSAWLHKRFHDQVNFSLNYVSGNALVVRTLLETRTNAVWLNDFGVGMVLAAARRTTAKQPFLLLADPADMDFVNRAVKNMLSERFAPTFVAEALGVPVRTANFIFGVTFERYDDMRTLKLRVLIIEEQALLKHFSPDGDCDRLEVDHPVFKARLQTLKALHNRYVEDRKMGRAMVDSVQLGVVV